MAEIRKHKPSFSPIARALEAAMGESIKPVVPGSRPDKGVEEAETKSESTPSAAAPATQWGSFTVTRPPKLSE
ncbi:hypothetical protein FYJ43_03150 [Cutibacterium sp. WCA-380-WT-3A]|uniref:Uncharacterized protein n=1 Tax=Cutibacterium porci TaxID=2605781 RepID=A0A7K0J553_9ACTN|nr:hypothetical protein [Cutibacterium porci]MSS45065.1 hypothetical protein [Cutibacterium porci]